MAIDRDPLLKSQRQIRAEVEEELALHLDLLTRELMATGLSTSDARAAAERRFGSSAKHRAECERVQLRYRQRQAWKGSWSGLTLDLRHASRTLLRSPSYSLIAISTLALSIGLATLVFSLVDGVLLSPLDLPHSERLYQLWDLKRESGSDDSVSPANYLDWREELESFAGLGAFESNRQTLTELGEPVRIDLAFVSGNLFAVYAVPPARGRWLSEDDVSTAAPSVVISDQFWHSYFGGREDVVGRTLTLDGESVMVVGVMPPGFDEPGQVELWRPLVFDFDLPRSRGAHYLGVVGRLRADRTLESAAAEAETLALALEKEYPRNNTARGIHLVPLREEIVGGSRQPLLTLLGAVGLVLLLGIANVTALALARGQMRRSELALRSAIGAGRLRILRQVTAENLLLSILGGLGGFALAAGGLKILRRALPYPLPRLQQVSIDARVLAFALCCALLTAFFVAAWISRQDSGGGSLSDRLRGVVKGRRTARTRFGLVGFELALAAVLVIGAGLLLRSLVSAAGFDPGFATEQRLIFRLGLPDEAYPDERVPLFYEQLEQRLGALAGVESVGLNPWIPFNSGWFFSYTIVGQPAPEPGHSPSAAFRVINDAYFEAIGIPLRQGRHFERADRDGSEPVVVVNEAFARRNFGGEEATGQRITVGYRNPSSGPIERTVVGVVGDVHQFRVGSGAVPTIYVPYRQIPFDVMTVVIHTAGDPLALAGPAREVVHDLDPALAIEQLQTLEQRVRASLDRQRFVTELLTGFAALALLIAGVGVYALLAQVVATRRREIGVRMAMGASGRQIAGWVLGHVLLLAGIGLGGGMLAALGLSRLLGDLLFEVSPADPTTFGLAGVVLLVLALLAAVAPARRALRMDPIAVLRGD